MAKMTENIGVFGQTTPSIEDCRRARFCGVGVIVFALFGVFESWSGFLYSRFVIDAGKAGQAAPLLERAFAGGRSPSSGHELWDRFSLLHVLFLGSAEFLDYLSAITLTADPDRPQEEISSHVRLLCRALSVSERAAQQSPANALYQIRWLDIWSRIMESGSRCPAAIADRWLKAGDEAMDWRRMAASRLRWAESLEPLSPVSLYLASVVGLRLGYREESLRLLQRSAALTPSFSAAQKLYSYRVVSTGDELSIAIARRYPAVVEWTDHFQHQRAADYEKWKGVFAEALQESFSFLQADLADGLISFRQYSVGLKRMADLGLARETEALRTKLDSLLAAVYGAEQNAKAARFYSRRSTLMRVPIRKAVVADDRTPVATPIANWTKDEKELVRFNVDGFSIGAHIPDGHCVREIVLQSDHIRGETDAHLVAVYQSRDNRSYSIRDGGYTTNRFTVDGRELITLSFDTALLPYIKVRYISSDQQGTFRNELGRIFEIFGQRGEECAEFS